MDAPEFEKFESIARYNRHVIVTEKIDGTNAQILITEDGGFFIGSRRRWITPENDNAGFARWCEENKEKLIEVLGFGRHYGEWWGLGIQRNYGLKDKRLSLFNSKRWGDGQVDLCPTVPILWEGVMDDLNTDDIMRKLKTQGSVAAPGFMNPEGIVVYHTKARKLFKKTFEHDMSGKPYGA